MAKSSPTKFQTFYRSTVMTGVLGCASMAAYNYGPRAEELAGMIDHAAGMVVELQDQAGEPVAVAPSAPAEQDDLLTFAAEPLSVEPLAQPLAAAPRPIVDPQVAPTGALQPIGAAPSEPRYGVTPDLDTLEQERLVAPLLAAGAVDAEIMPWGQSGELYRAAVSAPIDSRPDSPVRRLDAIAESPEQAVAQLRYKMER